MFSFISSWHISPFSKTAKYLYHSPPIWTILSPFFKPIQLHFTSFSLFIAKTPHLPIPSFKPCLLPQCQLFLQGYQSHSGCSHRVQVVYKWFKFWNEYSWFIRLKSSVKGISDIMKAKGDKEPPWNISQLIFISPRLMSPDINSVLRSSIMLGGRWPISFKAYQFWSNLFFSF